MPPKKSKTGKRKPTEITTTIGKTEENLAEKIDTRWKQLQTYLIQLEELESLPERNKIHTQATKLWNLINQDIEQNKEILENNNVDDIDNINLEGVEENNNIFQQPIDPSDGDQDDNNDENLIRRKNLKKYNYVFKNNNSSIEDLEKIPAYKRMGIEIDNLEQLSEETYSKTVLNEENKLDFPDVNTYLHDNVD